MNAPAIYRNQIVPALHHIQHEHGYLKREDLEAFSRESGIPLYRLQAVASFFPHFRLVPPPLVSVRVCRDMACHLNGGGEILKQLKGLASDKVEIEGVSCLGRCDRPPAACVGIHHAGARAAAAAHNGNGQAHAPAHAHGTPPEAGHGEAHGEHAHGEEERYYHGRSAEELKAIIEAVLAGKHDDLPDPDLDINLTLTQPESTWLINAYKDAEPDYAAVKKAVAARNASIRKAAETLLTMPGWTREKVERFATAVTQRGVVDFPVDAQLADAIRAWQTDDGWARGPELGGWMEPLLAELDDAHGDLRGLGGAGIPAPQKWRDIRDAIRNARKRRMDDRGFIVVNGDESEPATFKDREICLRAPHTVVEGVILAGLFSEATQGFIYLRHEYPEQIAACDREIKRAEKLGMCGVNAWALGRAFPMSVFTSPGGYICGEQSALIEAMSDRRGEPRNMPPKLETNGLDDRPTLVSNVETFAWVPYILIHGGKTYAELGQNTWKGRRFFSISGDLKRPGVYEVPMGMKLKELIYGENYCQGVYLDGKPAKLKAFAPSGPSGGFLPARLPAKGGLPRDHTKNKTWLALCERSGLDPNAQDLDILELELELNLFRGLSPTQALGAGLVVYAEGRDMAEQSVNSMEFYRNESCGKCVPCRVGSQKLVALGTNLLAGKIDADRWENELEPAVEALGKVMVMASICGLGRSVPVPLQTVVKFFNDDLEQHLTPGAGGAEPVDLELEAVTEEVVK